jgi:hypothetical protein
MRRINTMDDAAKPAAPTWLELESVKSLAEQREITSLSGDTIKRRYPHLIVQLSPRREGIKLRHALAIANGQMEATK